MVCKPRNRSTVLYRLSATKLTRVDANDLVRSCSLTTTTFDAAATSMGNSSSLASVTVSTASDMTMSTGTGSGSATTGSSTSPSPSPTSGSQGNYAMLQNSFFGVVIAGFLMML